MQRRIPLALAILAWVVAPSLARATLGGASATIEKNREALGATRTVTPLAQGQRHELTLPGGTTVRQYVSPSGFVYAVTWSGPRVPDLQEILGGYFDQLGTHVSRGGHNALKLAGNDLEVRATGHRGSFAGRAWVPSLVPAGVDVSTAVE